VRLWWYARSRIIVGRRPSRRKKQLDVYGVQKWRGSAVANRSSLIFTSFFPVVIKRRVPCRTRLISIVSAFPRGQTAENLLIINELIYHYTTRGNVKISNAVRGNVRVTALRGGGLMFFGTFLSNRYSGRANDFSEDVTI